MNNYYKDIIERAGEPEWFDENACPRYGDIHPTKVANIYADVVVFATIQCQACREEFVVAFSDSNMQRIRDNNGRTLLKSVADGSLFYGDPPNTRCCPSGPTMTSDLKQVLQVWKKNDEYEWEKHDAEKHETLEFTQPIKPTNNDRAQVQRGQEQQEQEE